MSSAAEMAFTKTGKCFGVIADALSQNALWRDEVITPAAHG